MMIGLRYPAGRIRLYSEAAKTAAQEAGKAPFDLTIEVARAAAHGVSEGTFTAAQGGDFKDGFLGSFVSKLGMTLAFESGVFGDALGSPRDASAKIIPRTITAALIGGTASKLGGGKFASGAASAMVSWLFNAENGPVAKPRQAASELSLSDEGLAFIAEKEGFRGEIYLDAAGKETIGYGHLIKPGERERFKGGITQTEAMELLKTDVAIAEAAVQRHVNIFLNQNEYDALVSFTFNLGAGNLRRSTLLRELNAGNYAGASNEFSKWVFAGNRRLRGLELRREQEQIMFRGQRWRFAEFGYNAALYEGQQLRIPKP